MDKPGEQISSDTKSTVRKDKSILLIDDDNTTCLLINEILSDFQVKITTIKNGKEAIEYMEKEKETDLVIIDIRLPDMSGFDVLKKLKTTNPAVPLIALTAWVNKQVKEICLNSGFTAFIEKPIDIDFFLSVINKYIS